MPISLICGGCQQPLSAPDGTGGRVVRCPHCGARLAVPGPPKPVPLAEPDADARDDTPVRRRPKRFRTKRKAGSGPAVVFAGLVVLAIGVIALIVWAVVGRSGGAGAPPKPPPGWVVFEGDRFAAFVPADVSFARNSQIEQRMAAQAPDAKVWMTDRPPVVFQVIVVKLPDDGPSRAQLDAALDAAIEGLLRGYPPGSVKLSQSAVTVDGTKARQIVVRMPGPVQTVLRLGFRGGYVVSHSAAAADLSSDADPRVKPFFDGFRYTR